MYPKSKEDSERDEFLRQMLEMNARTVSGLKRCLGDMIAVADVAMVELEPTKRVRELVETELHGGEVQASIPAASNTGTRGDNLTSPVGDQ